LVKQKFHFLLKYSERELNKLETSAKPIQEAGPAEGQEGIKHFNLMRLTIIFLELEMDDMEVYNGMIKLQENALDKLKAREILNSSGQIELKLKLDRQAKEQNPDLGAFTNINIDAYDTGDDLSKEVSKTINLPIGMFKLVSAGSVIKSDVRLNQQNLKPGKKRFSLKKMKI
jgi:hypothetical protein